MISALLIAAATCKSFMCVEKLDSRQHIHRSSCVRYTVLLQLPPAETIEAMQHPRKYFKSYCFCFVPLFFMIVPPGILLNVAFAKAGIATAGECSCLKVQPDSVCAAPDAWRHQINIANMFLGQVGGLKHSQGGQPLQMQDNLCLKQHCD